jgi:hypothetical protein
MIRAKGILGAAALSGAIALTGLAQKAPDFGGTWIGKTEVPGVGMVEVTLVLKKAEKGYAGTISCDREGVVGADTEIKDVMLDGADLSFIFPLADDTLLLMKLAVSGDKMAGHWEHPAGTTAPVELVKKESVRSFSSFSDQPFPSRQGGYPGLSRMSTSCD